LRKRHIAAGEYCVSNYERTSDEALKEAGINEAKSLVAALEATRTIFVHTLSAKSLKPDIFIVARVDNEESEAKMVRAGADRTMSPYGIGGRRLAMMTLKPLVVDFIDTTLDRNEFTLEGVKVIKGSSIESISVKKVSSASMAVTYWQ